jgi:hypothetical protein
MNKLFLIVALAALLSCTEGKKQETADTAQTKQIEEAALAEGNRISALAQQALGGQLKQAISEGGVPEAVKFCNVAAYPILDTLTTGLDAEIKRASLRIRNPKDAPTDSEREILEQYQTQLDNNQELQPVVEIFDNDQVLYARPIVMNNALCLNCHGTVGTQVSDETNALLKSLYPEDNAIGHQLGDLRGIWSITFSQEDLVAYLNQQ